MRASSASSTTCASGSSTRTRTRSSAARSRRRSSSRFQSSAVKPGIVSRSPRSTDSWRGKRAAYHTGSPRRASARASWALRWAPPTSSSGTAARISHCRRRGPAATRRPCACGCAAESLERSRALRAPTPAARPSCCSVPDSRFVRRSLSSTRVASSSVSSLVRRSVASSLRSHASWPARRRSSARSVRSVRSSRATSRASARTFAASSSCGPGASSVRTAAAWRASGGGGADAGAGDAGTALSAARRSSSSSGGSGRPSARARRPIVRTTGSTSGRPERRRRSASSRQAFVSAPADVASRHQSSPRSHSARTSTQACSERLGTPPSAHATGCSPSAPGSARTRCPGASRSQRS